MRGKGLTVFLLIVGVSVLVRAPRIMRTMEVKQEAARQEELDQYCATVRDTETREDDCYCFVESLAAIKGYGGSVTDYVGADSLKTVCDEWAEEYCTQAKYRDACADIDSRYK